MLFTQALEHKGVSPEGSDLIRHNLVVFREGQGALQVCHIIFLFDLYKQTKRNLQTEFCNTCACRLT